ncbi:MAG TPA: AraC family transcriptional regulator [Pseudomonadales bacterium]
MKKLFVVMCLLLCQPMVAHAADDAGELARQINELKEQVIRLNRDLFILQEELLFPADTQLAVFLSLDSGVFFQLDAVELQLDQRTVSHYLYTRHQLEALARGGIQRLWTGNIKSGEHELVAFFKGIDKDGRPLERAASLRFDKNDSEPVLLELQIIDAATDMRAHFRIEQWQP